MDRRGIARAAVIIMLGNLVTSALGFVRVLAIGFAFGASPKTDAWFAAYTVPQMFYDLIIGGAIAAALIPAFTGLAESSKRDFWRVVTTIFVLAAVVLVVMIGLLEIGAQPLMSVVASGFNLKRGHGRLALSAELVRVLLPTLFFWGLSAISLAALYSLGKRVAASFATACFHLGIILAAVFLASPLGIVALPIGASAGAAMQFLVQVPSLWRSRREVKDWVGRHIDFHDPHVRQILVLYAPVALGIVVSIGGQIADTNFKSHLSVGDLSAMQYATTLIQFPVGLVVAALGLALLPMISSDAAAERIGDMKAKLGLGFRLVLVLMVPSAIGFITLGHPIASLLFHHGKLGPLGASHIATALLGYAPQLPFIGFDQLLIFAFYAKRNTVTPMLAGVFGVCIYVTCAFLLFPLHILGLALANTIQIVLHALLLFMLLIRSIGGIDARLVLETAVKVGVASAIMAAAILLINPWTGDHALGRYTTLWAVALPILAAVTVYIAALYLLKVEEVRLIRDGVLARIRGDRSTAALPL